LSVASRVDFGSIRRARCRVGDFQQVRPAWIEVNPVLGNPVKRFGIALTGLAAGLVLTWACLYVASHVNWQRHSEGPATGCHEMGECPMPWWVAGVLLVYLFGPAVALCICDAVAWRRWTGKKWAIYTCCIVFLTVALYTIDRIY
jgi:hypothetical protein